MIKYIAMIFVSISLAMVAGFYIESYDKKDFDKDKGLVKQAAQSLFEGDTVDLLTEEDFDIYYEGVLINASQSIHDIIIGLEIDLEEYLRRSYAIMVMPKYGAGFRLYYDYDRPIKDGEISFVFAYDEFTEESWLFSVALRTDSVQTHRGIRIGDSRGAVEEIYGKPSLIHIFYAGGYQLHYTKENVILHETFEDCTNDCIVFYMDDDDKVRSFTFSYFARGPMRNPDATSILMEILEYEPEGLEDYLDAIRENGDIELVEIFLERLDEWGIVHNYK